MQDLVLRETSEGVTLVTLNRPDALNALSVAMRDAIANAFLEPVSYTHLRAHET